MNMKQFFKRPLVIIPLTISILFSIGWALRFKFTKYYYMQQFFKNSPAKIIKNHEKAFIEDREILSQYDLFYPSNGSKDAGPYINPMVKWEIGEVAHHGSLVLPEFVHKEMNKDWVTRKPLFQKMGLKFGWMKDLLQYDVWSPELGSPAYPEGKLYQTYSYPIPTYKDLMTWAKLRYLYGKETGDVKSALKEVRHLMRLIWTNDYLVSSMVVVNMLKIENQFEEIITPKEMGEWKFIPHDHLMRAKRYFYSLPMVTDIRLGDEAFDKYSKTTVGLCPMLNEGMMSYLAMRELLGDELKYGYERMDRKIKGASCRKSLLMKMWNDPSYPAFQIENQDPFELSGGQKILGDTYTWKQVKENHDLKVTIGYVLGAVSMPGYFRQYEQ